MKENFFKNAEDLTKAAQIISSKAPEKYQHSVYLYFIARHMVSLFEAAIAELPIQVWNEYRNSLDHFMRYVANSEKNSAQLEKMEGHLQRAALDMCKFTCIKMLEKTDKRIELETPECLRLVDNGKMYDDMLTQIEKIKSKLTDAKIHDSQLGENARNDAEILSMYLIPAFEALEIFDIFSKRKLDITKVSLEITKQKKDAVSKNSNNWYSWAELKKSVFQNFIWAILGAITLAIIQFLGA